MNKYDDDDDNESIVFSCKAKIFFPGFLKQFLFNVYVKLSMRKSLVSGIFCFVSYCVLVVVELC